MSESGLWGKSQRSTSTVFVPQKCARMFRHSGKDLSSERTVQNTSTVPGRVEPTNTGFRAEAAGVDALGKSRRGRVVGVMV